MAATTSQGKTFTIFMVGLTVAAAGLAFVASGAGKLALLVGLAGVAISFVGFLKIKSSEGEVPDSKQPVALKLAGLALALGGWLIVLFGLHLSSSVSGRMISALVGMALTLVGIIGILPYAANKNAIWKA